MTQDAAVKKPATEERARAHVPAALLQLSTPALSLGLVFLYLGLQWLSFLHEHLGLPVTPWNPALGMMFAVIILKGPAYGLVLFASVALAEVLVLKSGLGWPVILMLAAVVAAAYTGAATITRDLLRFSTAHFNTRDIAIVIASGLGGALISSLVLGLMMISARDVDSGEMASTAGLLALGDAIGISVVTPLVLRAVRSPDWLAARPPAVLLELGGYAAVIVVALGIILQPEQPLRQSLLYLLFVPVVVAAVRHGIDGACAALATVQLGLVGFLHLYGGELTQFAEYQLLMLVMTMTVLLVGAVVSERDAADVAAKEAAQQLQDMQNEAARTARLNLVSGLAAALAHEINQPLTAARALARSVGQLVSAEDADRSRTTRNVASMIEQIDHAAAVVRRMREFLGRGEPHVTAVQMKPLIEGALSLVQPHAAGQRIAVTLNPIDGLPPVLADRVQIQQVVLNLVRNAIDAIVESGRRDGRIAIAVALAASEREIEVAVSDNGGGIAPERVDTIFVPLSTTKAHGLGLGLSISQTIVQAHGGRIWVSGTSPEGTEIRFSLPIAREAT
ncbi:MAG: ATP-binding protein [Hyphomicrobiaceae bacterium]